MSLMVVTSRYTPKYKWVCMDAVVKCKFIWTVESPKCKWTSMAATDNCRCNVMVTKLGTHSIMFVSKMTMKNIHKHVLIHATQAMK